jgi:cytoskeletal protein CcmA (bactofilin family)
MACIYIKYFCKTLIMLIIQYSEQKLVAKVKKIGMPAESVIRELYIFALKPKYLYPYPMAKIPEIITPDELNKIINGTSFKGDITSNGDFRIDGTLKGSIQSKGKIVIGPSGSIEGEIRCKNAEIFGKVTAKIYVEELLSLRTSAELSGEIVYNKIAIEAGAKLVGNLTIKDQIQGHVSRPVEEKPEELKTALR